MLIVHYMCVHAPLTLGLLSHLATVDNDAMNLSTIYLFRILLLYKWFTIRSGVAMVAFVLFDFDLLHWISLQQEIWSQVSTPLPLYSSRHYYTSAHFGFSLHPPDYQWCWASFCSFVDNLFVFIRQRSIWSFPHFKIELFFVIEFFEHWTLHLHGL